MYRFVVGIVLPVVITAIIGIFLYQWMHGGLTPVGAYFLFG